MFILIPHSYLDLGVPDGHQPAAAVEPPVVIVPVCPVVPAAVVSSAKARVGTIVYYFVTHSKVLLIG
jgi:hypothetical protein